MAIIISKNIETKLSGKHSVTVKEVEQCFDNSQGGFLVDTREAHKSDPQTMWFISTTNKDRILKVVFIFKDGDFFIRTAYEPNADELNIYINNGL